MDHTCTETLWLPASLMSSLLWHANTVLEAACVSGAKARTQRGRVYLLRVAQRSCKHPKLRPAHAYVHLCVSATKFDPARPRIKRV